MVTISERASTVDTHSRSFFATYTHSHTLFLGRDPAILPTFCPSYLIPALSLDGEYLIYRNCLGCASVVAWCL